MSLNGLDHVAVAVDSLNEAIESFQPVLERDPTVLVQEDQGARLAIFSFGNTRLELLEPLSEESPLAGFLRTEGEGLHHVALKTDSINEDLDRVSQLEDVTCIDSTPRKGAEDYRIAFLHPKSFHGTLLEFAQPPEDPAGSEPGD